MDTSLIKLSIAALLPVAASAVIFLLDKNGCFKKISEKSRQMIIGIVFGLLAVVGTEWGIPMANAQVNCRDAAVLAAGLLFGSRAGIIAGLIGGIERWFSVYWGIGSFTRVACTLSTIFAGFYASFLRKKLLENKRPGWLLSFEIGVVMEVFHLTMVFLTNMNQTEKAIAVVKACTIPMVIANGLSVMLASLVIGFIAGDNRKKSPEKVRISQSVQTFLLVVVLLAFFSTSYFVYELQTRMAESAAEKNLRTAVSDLAVEIENAGDFDKYEIAKIITNRHIGENGYTAVADSGLNILSCSSEQNEEALSEVIKRYSGSVSDYELIKTDINGRASYIVLAGADGFYAVGVMDKEEVYSSRNTALYVNTFMEILTFAVLFILIYFIIDKVVVSNIHKINTELQKISSGDLSSSVEVRTSEEFNSLSDDINSTVDALKGYISDAENRMESDLNMAKDIQTSALQTVFPAFPKRKDFDIYAMMCPAKEVGGDFYDMYMTHSRYLNFLVADVSGKGIPAAMFMMRAKTELEGLTKADNLIDEVFTMGNSALCEGNDAGMFVTAWQGGVNLGTGLMEYANAGHNPPVIKHKDGSFEFLKTKVNLVLGAMDGVPYALQSLQLSPGDIVFLYTDGVTEATDKNNELFGEERLLETLNNASYIDMHDLCNAVKRSVDEFVGEAPQFDDITMLAFRYFGPGAPRWFTLDAEVSGIPRITEFADGMLDKLKCPESVRNEIDIAIDEMFTNIASYAYGKETGGRMGVIIEELEEPHGVELQFCDSGEEYNPLLHTDPDITLSADEREIGGLGILMVKKMMDECSYERTEGKNIFKIRKYF